ncbi:MAG: TIGR01212 family radical SAM protein [Elusimicrobiota bacterium]
MKKAMQRYNKFSQYLKNKYNCRVYKVSVDAGFNCPNRDGSLAQGGCIFCNNRGFSFNTRTDKITLKQQISTGIEFVKKRYKAEKFFIYFQAFTNTYAPLDVLKKKYSIVKEFEDIVGVCVSTRPDCINKEILDIIEEEFRDYRIWIELGLQSINNKTLKLINRNHTYEDFLDAFKLIKHRGNIKICVHTIIGLPGEDTDEIMGTAKEMARLKVDGIKIHPLHVMKDTALENMYNNGQYSAMDIKYYADLATEFLQYLHPDTVVQRITAQCLGEYLVAPDWIKDKNKQLREIEKQLEVKDRYQGKLVREDVREKV